MNIFVIPSWYPTSSHPSTGIFYQEQTKLLAKEKERWNFGISLWGSHEPKLWVKVTKPFHALIQLTFKLPLKRKDRVLSPNLIELFTPAYTWTRRIFRGNINGIIRANEENLQRYIQVFGKPDVIHAHISHPAGLIAMKLSEKYNIPYVITEQMSPFPLPNYRKDFRKYLLPQLKQADKVLSVGKNLSAELEHHGVNSYQVVNFIDFERFAVTEPPNNNPPILFSLGRLEKQKGFDLLLNALGKLPTRQWKLVLGGEGSQCRALQKICSRSGLSDQVIFTGEMSQEKVIQHMQACDFFVLSSRHESFGIVLLEAMACGKPVLYTKCGGITLELPPFVGRACQVSEEGLIYGLDQMLGSYQEYKADQIRNYALSNYSVHKAAEQLEGVYNEVIRSK